MAKPKNEAAVKTALEKFTIIEIDRSQILNAEYNPRVITDAAKRKLKTGIKKLGMLGPIIWNKLSGNIVGGHQRVSIMDTLEGSKNYRLTVSAVGLTPKQEREANLLLNNASAMGEFDLGKLEEMLKFPELDVEATGWDHADVFKLFGDNVLEDDESAEENAKAAQELADRARKTHDALKKVEDDKDRNDNDGFFLVVVFKDYDARLAFTNAVGWEDNRYQSAEDLKALLKLDE